MASAGCQAWAAAQQSSRGTAHRTHGTGTISDPLISRGPDPKTQHGNLRLKPVDTFRREMGTAGNLFDKLTSFNS